LGIGGGRAALFVDGSLAAHSCAPNCAHAVEDGELTLTATRRVEDGEAVTFSYVGDVAAVDAGARAQSLARRFEFACACDRCGGLDATLSQKCRCGWFASPRDGAFVCARCGPLGGTFDAAAAYAAAASRTHLEKLAAAAAAADGATADALAELVDRCEAAAVMYGASLSPRHAVARDGLDLLDRVLAAALRRLRPTDDAFPALVDGYARNALKRVAALECVLAGCANPGACEASHAPHPGSAGLVFSTAIAAVAASNLGKRGDLAHLKTRAAASAVAARYLPNIKLAFPNSADDIRKLEANLKPAYDDAAAVCPPCPADRKPGAGRKRVDDAAAVCPPCPAPR